MENQPTTVPPLTMLLYDDDYTGQPWYVTGFSSLSDWMTKTNNYASVRYRTQLHGNGIAGISTVQAIRPTRNDLYFVCLAEDTEITCMVTTPKGLKNFFKEFLPLVRLAQKLRQHDDAEDAKLDS